MAAVTAAIEVSKPGIEVFDYATDPSRFHEWQDGVVGGHLDGAYADAAPSPRLGAHCVTVRRIGFAERPITSEIVLFDPPRQWAIRGIDGPIRAYVDVLVEPVTEDRSRLTITVDFAGRGIGRLLVPLVVVGQARKEMPTNLDRLRRRLEVT